MAFDVVKMFKMNPTERRDLNGDNVVRNNKYSNHQRRALIDPPNHQYGFGDGSSEDWRRCGPLMGGRNPSNQRNSWYGPNAYLAYPNGSNYYGTDSWLAPYRQQQEQQPLEPVEYSVPIQVGGSHRTEDELRECRYYNGVFRRGTPRPVNMHCYGDRYMTEDDETMDTDNDSGRPTPQLFPATIPPSPQEYRASSAHNSKRITRSMSRRRSITNNQSQLNQQPSTSNPPPTITNKSSSRSNSESQSESLEAQQPTEHPTVKKGLLGRFSLRTKRNGTAETVVVRTTNDDKKETTNTMKKLRKDVEKNKRSASSDSETKEIATNVDSQLAAVRRTDPVTSSRINTPQKKSLKRLKNKAVGVKLLGGAAAKTDRTSKWEKVAMKSRALFLKNRSQKMLKERLSKYRLVSPRLNTSDLIDPMTSDTTIKTLAITRKTSSVACRLSDLNQSQNIAANNVSKLNDENVTATSSTTVATSPSNTTKTETQITDALVCDTSTAHTPLVMSSSTVSTNDLSFTPFFQCDDWRKLVQEARQQQPSTSSTSTVSSSTPVVAPFSASVNLQSARSIQHATTSTCPQNLEQTDIKESSSLSSPSHNIEVSNEVNSPPTEIFLPAPVKIETDDEDNGFPDVDKTLVRTSISRCASVGTSDVSIGCMSPDFSSMDDDAKLKRMWTLVAKETSLNASRMAIDEKLSKIQAEVVALLNERNKIDSEISTLRETKNRLLQSAGDHAPIRDSFGNNICNNSIR